jgi:chromosome segregation ATPase
LEQLDQNIQKLQKLQQSLNDSISSYQNKINEIDDKIGKIKVERKEVNNFYTQKKEEIKNADKKQIDSLLRGRYNF